MKPHVPRVRVVYSTSTSTEYLGLVTFETSVDDEEKARRGQQ